MGSILDNPSRFNNYIVRTGLRIDHGAAASAYILYKKLERRIKSHVTDVKVEYDFTTITAVPKVYEMTKGKYNKIVRYVDNIEYMCLVRLDGINKMSQLEDYLKIEDTNAMIHKIIGRNINVKINNILN